MKKYEFWNFSGKVTRRISKDGVVLSTEDISIDDFSVPDSIKTGRSDYDVFYSDYGEKENDVKSEKEAEMLDKKSDKNDELKTRDDVVDFLQNGESSKTSKKSLKEDMVNSPSHYKDISIYDKKGTLICKVEAIELIDSILNNIPNLTPAQSLSLGNNLKYILRIGKKNLVENQGDEDGLKAEWYIHHFNELRKQRR